MTKQDIFSELKETVKKQVQDAYMAGAHEGAIVTASTIYSVLINMGLEKDNIIFDFLRDIAKRHGCPDLEAYSLKLKDK